MFGTVGLELIVTLTESLQCPLSPTTVSIYVWEALVLIVGVRVFPPKEIPLAGLDDQTTFGFPVAVAEICKGWFWQIEMLLPAFKVH